jgi:undecaprenyl-diphosphatase
MNILESIILGLTQGLTEFLPISSSGHLILIREILHLPLAGSLAYDVFLNTATLLAVIYCFWGDLVYLTKDLITEGFSARSKNLIYCLILGTIPAGVLGFLYSHQIENAFRSSHSVAFALIAGSVLMFVADRLSRQGGLSPIKGFIVGIFQALALIPGVSRSGSTISGGLIVGLSREEAIRFSFLLLIPVSLGALLKTFLDIGPYGLSGFIDLSHLVAFATALLSGIWAVRFLIRYLSKNSFTPFIIYRLVLAVVILLFL